MTYFCALSISEFEIYFYLLEHSYILLQIVNHYLNSSCWRTWNSSKIQFSLLYCFSCLNFLTFLASSSTLCSFYPLLFSTVACLSTFTLPCHWLCFLLFQFLFLWLSHKGASSTWRNQPKANSISNNTDFL